jgi:SAM-dependent methyltransferase
MLSVPASDPRAGLLGDTPARDYSRKLALFNAFAEPELRALISSLPLPRAARILDAGCGTGEALNWLFEAAGPEARVTGIDLSAAHATAARRTAAVGIEVLVGDFRDTSFTVGTFDLVWCVNALNHLRDPIAGARGLAKLLRPGGRMAIGQSALLPDMLIAWDATLERTVHDAVHRYYRDQYGLRPHDLAGVRALVGVLRKAGLERVAARTIAIERVSPLDAPTAAYLLDAIFRGTWGARLKPYLEAHDFEALSRLTDPNGDDYALERADFHLLQTFTLVTGSV